MNVLPDYPSWPAAQPLPAPPRPSSGATAPPVEVLERGPRRQGERLPVAAPADFVEALNRAERARTDDQTALDRQSRRALDRYAAVASTQATEEISRLIGIDVYA